MTTIQEQITLVSEHLDFYKQLAAAYPDAATNEQGLWVSGAAVNTLTEVEIINGSVRKFAFVGPLKVYGPDLGPSDLAARLDQEVATKQAQLDALNAELAAKQSES